MKNDIENDIEEVICNPAISDLALDMGIWKLDEEFENPVKEETFFVLPQRFW